MKIACPSCSAKYSIADEKVQNRLAKIRCRKCGTTIVIDGKASPPTVQSGDVGAQPQQADAGASAAAGEEFTVDVGENDQRNMTIPMVVEAYNNGTITADTYVWKDGMPDWIPLADVPEINEALHAAAAAHDSAAPQPGPDFTSSVPTPDVESPSPAAAAVGLGAGLGGVAVSSSALGGSSPLGDPGLGGVARASASGGATDLFGGIDAAGGEADIATSAADGGVSAATGARNESSVLFSLSALTAAQEDKPESSGASEDSGLIDLAALTSSAAAAPPPPTGGGGLDLGSAPLAASPLGGAPLTGGTAAPLGLEAMPAQGAGNRNGLYIGGGIVVAVGLAGLFALLLKDDPQPVAAAPTATVLVPTVVPTASAPAEVAATDEKDDDEEEANDEADEKDDAKGATAAVAQPRKRVYRKKSTSSGSSSKTGSSSGSTKKKKKSTTTKKKKKSKCNCAPSDLMCAMKCSAK